jgi:hypothetical protein
MLGVKKIVFTPRVGTSMAIENIAFDRLRNQFLDRFSHQPPITDAKVLCSFRRKGASNEILESGIRKPETCRCAASV